MADLQAGRHDAACPLLRKSYRLEKRPRTLFHLAECEERAGRIATAALHYDEYLDALERLSPPEQQDEAARQKLALERRERLDADIPRVTFRLPEAAPKGTKVTRSSKASPDAVPVVLGVPMPVDPGEQWVRTEPPGGPPRDRRFFVNRKERLTIDLTVAQPGDEAKTVRYSRPLEPVPVLLPPAVDDGMSGWRLGGYIAAGVLGLGGIATSVATGVVAAGQKDTITTNCAGGFCNEKGEGAADRAATMGVVSTMALPIGLVGVAGVVLLLVTEPERVRLGRANGPTIVRRSTPVILVGASGRSEGYVGATWTW
ncbi:tetratricopeptide repeat protein [Sorangium sp. So ce295]|uniref:hypothetical protein n=1 Tax=Sorangium sp. So ce295 TaxID=3133295 RepID=UPI003F5E6094